MDEINDRDVHQQYGNTTVLYKKSYVHVDAVHEDGMVTIRYLRDGSVKQVPFVMSEFSPVRARLGFVNVLGRAVVYVQRMPIRQFQTGLSRNNTVIAQINYDYDGLVRVDAASYAIRHMDTVDVLATLRGDYPSFKKSVETIETIQGCAIAFDRQFAVDGLRRIWYKTKVVGGIPTGKYRARDIVFKKGFEPLLQLIK